MSVCLGEREMDILKISYEIPPPLPLPLPSLSILWAYCMCYVSCMHSYAVVHVFEFVCVFYSCDLRRMCD